MSSSSARCAVLGALCLLWACSAEVGPEFAPAPRAMVPRGAPAASRTPVEIDGAFYLIGRERVGGNGGVDALAGFLASLDGVALEEVRWLDSGRLSAVVPAGLDPGVHALKVTSPFGLSGTLAAAWTAGSGEPAQLSALATAPARVSAGQTFSLEVTAQNAGGAAALAVTPTLSAPGATVGLAPSAKDLPAQGALVFSWTLSAAAAGTLTLAPSLAGTDAVSGLALQSAASATVRVQAAPALFGLAGALPARVSVGQPVELLLDVTNTGGADVLALQLEAPSSTGAGSLRLGPAPGPQDLPAGATHRFSWSAVAATPGAVALSVAAAGADGNGAGIVALPRTAWGGLQIDAPATLSLGAPSLPAQVSVGQSFQLTAVVANAGGAAARAVTPSLQAGGAGSLDVLSSPAPLDLAGGAQATLTWTLRAAQPGPVTLSRAATGADANSAAPLSAAAVAAVLVQRPPSLSGVLVATPAQASVGQALALRLDVTNAGEAAALAVLPALPATSGGGAALAGPPPTAQDLPAGATRSYVWSYTATAAGALVFSTGAAGADANGAGPVTLAKVSAAPVLVQTPAGLTALLSAPAAQSLGDTFPVTLSVGNSGTAAALAVVPSLVLSGAGTATVLSAPTAQDVPAGASRTFTWSLGAGGAGSLSLSAGAAGTDANSGLAATATATSTVLLQTPAALSATLAVPAAADVGQTFTVSLSVRNTGGAAAMGVAPTPLSDLPAGLATPLVGPSPASADIPGGGARDFLFTFVGASPGSLTLSAGAAGHDANDGLPAASTQATASMTIDRPAQLGAKLSLSRGTVEVGQSFTAVLALANSGTATATAATPAALALSSTAAGAASVTAGPAPASADLAGGATGSFTWSLQATAAGRLLLSAQASATDADSGQAVSATSTASLLVQTAPVLSAQATLSAGQVSIGQDLQLSLVVGNVGQTAVLQLLPVLPACAAVSQTGAPAAQDVPGGGSATFTWSLHAAASGSCPFSLSGSGADANTGAPVALPAASASLLVQTAALLSATLTASPALADTGQAVTLTLHVANVGDARAAAVAPSIAVAPAGAAAQQGSAPAAVDIPGHGSADFTWTFAPSTPGTLTFDSAATGHDQNSGAAVSSAGTTTVQAQRPAALSGSFAVGQTDVNLGQPFTTSLTVTNAGDSAALSVLPGTVAVAGSGTATLVSAPSAAGIPGGAAVTFTWTWQATGLGTLAFSVAASGTDALSGAAVSAPLAVSPSLTVRTQASLTATATLSAARLSVGQPFTLSLKVTNLGQSKALSVSPSVPQPSSAGVATATSGAPPPQDIAGGASATFTWSYAAAAPGMVSYSSAAAGTDATSGGALSSSSAVSPALEVQQPATLSATAAALPQTVNLGDAISVVLTASNGGGAAAAGVAPSLSVSPAAAATLASGPLPASASIAGGGDQTFTYSFSAAQTGTATFSGRVNGTDGNSGAAVASGSSSAAVLVQRAAALSATLAVPPDPVDTGQPFTVTMTVKNAGDSTARAVAPSALTASGPATLVSGPPAADVAGGATVTFTWTYLASTPGGLAFSGSAAGTDAVNGAAVAAPAVASGALLVQAPAALSAALALAPAQASLGQTLALTLHVTNTGGADALSVAPSVPSPSRAGAATLLTGQTQAAVRLASGASADFTWTFRADTTGPLSFTAQAAGRNANTGSPISASAASTASLLQAPAALSASLQASPATANTGQSVLVTLSVSNSGEAGASAVVPSLSVTPATGVTVSPPNASAAIAGGAARSFSWTLTTTASGTFALSVTAAGTDANSGASVSASASASVTIQRPAALSATLSAPAQASAGQTFAVALTLTNSGGAAALGALPSALSLSGSAAGTAQIVSGPTPVSSTVAGAGNATFTWRVLVQSTGSLSFSASASGTDQNSGAAVVAAAASANTSVGTVVLSTSVAPSQAVVSVGQTVTFRLTVTNTGTVQANPFTPGAPTLGGPGTLVLTFGPKQGGTIDPGETLTLTWTYLATGAGTVTFSVGGSTLDNNTGLTVSVPTASGSLLVQTAAALSAALSVAPSLVNKGLGFTVTLAVSNSGQAAATAVAPRNFAASPGTSVTKVSGPAPASAGIPGGGSASFTWSYTASAVGSVTFSSAAQGSDFNSGQTVTSATATASLVIQAPAALAGSWVVPAQADTGDAFTVSYTVANSGDAAASAVAPSALIIGGTTGAATYLSGPTPASAAIAGHGSASFTWSVRAVTPGASVTCSASASGTDATSGSAVSAAAATSAPVQLLSPASLSATLAMPGASAVGSSFSVVLTVSNGGGAGATVTPSSPPVASGGNTGAATLSAGPSPAGPVTVAGGGAQAFTWTYTATAKGTFGLTASASGTDVVDGRALSASAAASTTVQSAVAPLLTSPPFPGTRSTSFAYVFGYQAQVWLGPSGDSSGAVLMDPDGTGVAAISFQYEYENTVNFTARNLAYFPSTPAQTLGYAGCAPNTTACGPDNEAGRGLFFSGTIAGTEWLVVTGARASGGDRFLYMTNPLFNSGASGRTDFAYFNVFAALHGSTVDLTAARFIRNQIFLGYGDTASAAVALYLAPVLAKTLTTPAQPGKHGTSSDVVSFEASFMPRIGSNGGANANPLRDSGLPIYLDAIGAFGTAPDDAVYLGNNGGWLRSTTSTPSACTAPGTCTTWVDTTPTDANYASRSSYVAANTAQKFSDLEPADKATAGFVAFGGKLFAGRNTTAGPQLWVCTPTGSFSGGAANTQCNPGDWKLAAPNTRGGLDTALSQMNDTGNTSLTLLVAAGGALFVGYNNASGVQLYRTGVASPNPVVTDFSGAASCTSGAACPGLGGQGLGLAATRVFDSRALTDKGVNYLFLTAGTGSSNVSVLRVTP